MPRCATCDRRVQRGSTRQFVCSRGDIGVSFWQGFGELLWNLVREPSGDLLTLGLYVGFGLLLFGFLAFRIVLWCFGMIFLVGLLIGTMLNRPVAACCNCAELAIRCDQCEAHSANICMRRSWEVMWGTGGTSNGRLHY